MPLEGRLVDGQLRRPMFGLVNAGELNTATILIENAGAIIGRVVDDAGKPVEDAEIWLAHDIDSFRVSTSAAGGRFEVHGVKAKSVAVFAKKRGHAPSSRKFNFTNEGATFEVELALRGPAGVLDGTVRDTHGVGIANALVMAGPKGTTSWMNPRGLIQMLPEGTAVKTDELGRYEFEGILAGPSEIYVQALDCIDAKEMFDIASGQVTHHDVNLMRGGVLSGIVKGSDGKPTRSGRVQARAQHSGLMRSALIGESGEYRIPGLEPGEIRATVTDGEQVETLEEALTISATEETVWNPTLSGGPELVGRVLDENDEPVTTGQVYVRRDQPGEESFARAQSMDKEGRFKVKGCRPVEYVVSVYPKGSQLFAIAEVRGVRPGGDELVIRLDPRTRPSAYIKGRVIGPDGQTLGGIKVTPFGFESDYNATQLTQPDGSFQAGPFPAGPWGMDISAEGLAPFTMGKRVLLADQTLDLGTIQLARGDVIDVHLVYPDDPHSTRLYVEVHGLDSPIEEWCKVESDHARTPPLPPGRYRMVFAGAYAACNLDAEIVSGRETRLELALKPGIEFKIRPDDQRQGEPTRVTMRLRDGAGEQLMERTPRIDQLKSYQLSVCLAPGHYRIEATDTTGRTWSHEFEVDASTAQQVVAIELR